MTAPAPDPGVDEDRPAGLVPPWRGRTLGALSIALAIGSYFVRPDPIASAFPWLTLGLWLCGAGCGVAALRQPRRGRAGTALAWLGIALALVFPALVIFVFVRFINWSS